MDVEALKVALRLPEAWESLTAHQSSVVRTFIEYRTISATARFLNVSRQAVMKSLRLAGKKFLAFAQAA